MTEPRYVVSRVLPDADWCFVKDTVIGRFVGDSFGAEDLGEDYEKLAQAEADRLNEIEDRHAGGGL